MHLLNHKVPESEKKNPSYLDSFSRLSIPKTLHAIKAKSGASDNGLSSSGASSMLESPERPISVPPQDEGRKAWMFLAGASIILFSSWGFSMAFGVFRQYYFTHPPFAGISSISEIGVIGVGLAQAMTPFLLRFLSGHSNRRKTLMWLGMIVCTAASLGAAFAKTAVQLIMTQGVLQGIGTGLLFAPSVSLLEEWFDKRRSFAYGIFFGVSTGAGVVLPPICSVLLEKYGPRSTMLGWGVVSGVLLGGSVLCSQPRLPCEKEVSQVQISYGFFKKPLFWLLATATVWQALAAYLPGVYLPSYASDIGVSVRTASLLLTFLNIASVIGQPILGWIADRSVLTSLLLQTVTSSLTILLIWGFSQAYWSLTLFALIFGAFGAGFVILRSRFARAIVGRTDPDQELIVSGTLMFVRGAASASSGFVGAALLKDDAGISHGYGAGKYRPLIIFIGVIFGAASVSAIGLLPRSRSNEETMSLEPEP